MAHVRARLDALLGPGAVEAASERWAVDGLVPALAVRPSDAAQVADVLRVCAELRAAVVPAGGGTMLCAGNPPRAAHVLLLAARLDRVIDHDASNLTVTVEAGVGLPALQGVLAGVRQHVPLDPPLAGGATVGGSVAVAPSGYRRLQYGGVRDLVIGMKAVTGDGTAIRWGGKTVKNVAGYDLARLLVGSLGTLGVITEVTFKVFPLAETSATLLLSAPALAAVQALVDRLRASVLQPSAVTVLSPVAASAVGRPDRGYVLAVLVEGVEAAVTRSRRDLQAWAGEAGAGVEEVAHEEQARWWRSLTDLGWTGEGVVACLSVPPGRSLAVVGELTQASEVGLAGVAAVAHAGTGTVWVAAPPPATPAQVASWQAAAARHGGSHWLARAPVSLKQAVGDVWSPPPPPRAVEVMRGLKRTLDPGGILNPGRFVAGI